MLLGGKLSVEYTSSFHLFTHLCPTCLTVQGSIVRLWLAMHILFGRVPQGTPLNSCYWSGEHSQQGRRSYQCYSVCARLSVCLFGNLAAKRPYGHSQNCLFILGRAGLLLSLANPVTSSAHCIVSLCHCHCVISVVKCNNMQDIFR